MTIYAVDIDGTLCIERKEFWNYDKAQPIPETIEKINALYDNKSNTIVIYTARFHEDKETTRKWLKKHGVKYHRLVTGKFRADIYVDSASMRPEAL
jgi:uncharacterized HAD superfamily protein